MDFFSCLSKSISDLVSRSETNKILGFVGCEGAGLDAEDVKNFILMPFLKFFDHIGVMAALILWGIQLNTVTRIVKVIWQ